MRLSTTFRKAHLLYLGTNVQKLTEYPSFIHVKSYFNDKWYNYIVPKIDNTDDLDQNRITAIIEAEKKSGTDVAYYIHDTIKQSYSRFLAGSKCEELGNDTYLTIKLQPKYKIKIAAGYSITSKYNLDELIDTLQKCFTDWPNEKVYSQLYEKYKKDGQSNRVFETFCIKYKDRIVAAASITVDKELGISYLHNDGTLKYHRRKGLHQALVLKRLNYSVQNDVDEVFSVVEDGSGSFHSMTKTGFKTNDKFWLYCKK